MNVTLRLQDENCTRCGTQLARVFDNDAKEYVTGPECLMCARSGLAEAWDQGYEAGCGDEATRQEHIHRGAAPLAPDEVSTNPFKNDDGDTKS